jgi:hypothetical protein
MSVAWKRRGERLVGAFSSAVGWIVGLSAGLQHGFVGGPAIISEGLWYFDPVAGRNGLIAGSVVGLGLGVLVALAFARAARQPQRRILLLGVALVVVGVMVWALPAWYLPLKVIDVP